VWFCPSCWLLFLTVSVFSFPGFTAKASSPQGRQESQITMKAIMKAENFMVANISKNLLYFLNFNTLKISMMLQL
jgi:hypothetical protein